MLPRQLPHIILRFRHRADPPPSDRSASTTPDGYATALEHSYSSAGSPSSPQDDSSDDSVDSDATESDPEMRTRARSARPMRSAANRLQVVEGGRAPLPLPPRTTIKLKSSLVKHAAALPEVSALPEEPDRRGLKRKRGAHIPKAIGGGKGELKPELVAQEDRRVDEQNDGEKKEEKRFLRSQGTQKKGEWDEWFEEPKPDTNDIQMEIVDGEVPPDPPPSPPPAPPPREEALAKKPTEESTEKPATTSASRHKSKKSKKRPPTHPSGRNTPDVDTPAYVPYMQSIPIIKLDLEQEAAAAAAAAPPTRPSTRLSDPQLDADPLADDLYLDAHTKAARKEKRLQNLEMARHTTELNRIRATIQLLHLPDWPVKIRLSEAIIRSTPREVLEERRIPLLEHLQGLVERAELFQEHEKSLRDKGGKKAPAASEGAASAEPDPPPAKTRRGARAEKTIVHPDEFDVPVTSSEEDPGSEADAESSDAEPARRRKRRPPPRARTAPAEPPVKKSRGGSKPGNPNRLAKANEARRRNKELRDAAKAAAAAAEGKTEKPKPEKAFSFFENPAARARELDGRRKSDRNLRPFGRELPSVVTDGEVRDFVLDDELVQDRRAKRLKLAGDSGGP